MPSSVPQMVLLAFVETKVRLAAGKDKTNRDEQWHFDRLSANGKLVQIPNALRALGFIVKDALLSEDKKHDSSSSI